MLDHPHTYAFAIHTLAFVFHDLRRVALLERFGALLLDLADQHGFPAHRAGGLFALGSGALFRGDDRSACDLLRRSLEAHEMAHSNYLVPQVLGNYALALLRSGKLSKAKDKLDQALNMVEQNEERCFEAPLRLSLGELLQSEDVEAAEAQFRLALQIAHDQDARWFELRSATRLAGLMVKKGDREGARDLLSSSYTWFTEGFDTHDLKDARQLLDSLL
jgi:predicted ATPase